jgi:hypothetical protein
LKVDLPLVRGIVVPQQVRKPHAHHVKNAISPHVVGFFQVKPRAMHPHVVMKMPEFIAARGDL